MDDDQLETTFRALKYGKHNFDSVMAYVLSLGRLHGEGLLYIHEFSLRYYDGLYDILVVVSIRDEDFNPVIISSDKKSAIPVYNSSTPYVRHTHSFMTEREELASDLRSVYNGMPYFKYRYKK